MPHKRGRTRYTAEEKEQIRREYARHVAEADARAHRLAEKEKKSLPPTRGPGGVAAANKFRGMTEKAAEGLKKQRTKLPKY